MNATARNEPSVNTARASRAIRVDTELCTWLPQPDSRVILHG